MHDLRMICQLWKLITCYLRYNIHYLRNIIPIYDPRPIIISPLLLSTDCHPPALCLLPHPPLALLPPLQFHYLSPSPIIYIMSSKIIASGMLDSQAPFTYEELLQENYELRNNLETLLQYNNKLLGIIEDLNRSPSSALSHQRCTEESKFLWKKLSSLESYSYQLQMELEQFRNQKHNQQQLEKELREVLESNEIVQKKFEMKITQVMQEIQDIKGSQEQASERLIQFLQDRQQKVQEIYDQFQYKDEIIELLAQKVRLFQEEYLKKQGRESVVYFRDRQQVQSRMTNLIKAQAEDKVTQTDSVRVKKDAVVEKQVQELRRVVEIYENLVRRVKTKLQDKIV